LWTKLQLRAFQHGASEWQEWGRSASDSSDWLRRKSIQAETRVYPQPLIP
jgi:hypothetical protein